MKAILISNKYFIILVLILLVYINESYNYYYLNKRINKVVAVMNHNDSLEAATIRELIETANKQIELDKTILVKFLQLYHNDTVNFNNFRTLKAEVSRSNPNFRYRDVDKCVHY
jgi:hypothetical protein